MQQEAEDNETQDILEVSYRSPGMKKKPVKKKKGPNKYKAVNLSMKKDKGILVLPAVHLCGNKMLCCVQCNRCFCPECDIIMPKTACQCCEKAFTAYEKDNGEKNLKRQELKKELSKRVRRGNTKYKVVIEEIKNDNKL